MVVALQVDSGLDAAGNHTDMLTHIVDTLGIVGILFQILFVVLAHYSVCKLYHSMNLPGKIGMVNFCMPAYPKNQYS